MFDTNIKNYTTDTVFVDRNINIKRAPTDESIKLYDEMKEKAYASLIDSFSVKNNIVNFEVVYYKEFATLAHCLYFVFKINGKTISKTIKVEDSLNREQMFRNVVDKISEHLTAELLSNSDIHLYIK